MDGRISNLAQIAYVRRYTIDGGREDGLKVIEINNGVLRLTLNESKALDVMQLWHKGDNISFISKNGFDEGGMELDLEYNEAKTKVSFDVVIGSAPGEEASDEENALQYYYYTFVRGTNAIYVSQMLCAESDATYYVGLFKEWSATMKAS